MQTQKQKKNMISVDNNSWLSMQV